MILHQYSSILLLLHTITVTKRILHNAQIHKIFKTHHSRRHYIHHHQDRNPFHYHQLKVRYIGTVAGEFCEDGQDDCNVNVNLDMVCSIIIFIFIIKIMLIIFLIIFLLAKLYGSFTMGDHWQPHILWIALWQVYSHHFQSYGTSPLSWCLKIHKTHFCHNLLEWKFSYSLSLASS